MTYTHARPIRSEGLNDEQRAQLTELERIARPTPYARGAVNALRLCATDAADRSRIAGLIEKWGAQQ